MNSSGAFLSDPRQKRVTASSIQGMMPLRGPGPLDNERRSLPGAEAHPRGISRTNPDYWSRLESWWMEQFDAIVIGAGPAGSTMAYRLAREGARVLLLDKARFPRDKPCGGGLSVRAMRE